MFKNCRKLNSIVLPNTLATIGDKAFAGCVSLAQINLPDSITTIGESCFDSCAISSVYIPAALTDLGIAAFAHCHRMQHIDVDTANPKYLSQQGVVYNKTPLQLVYSWHILTSYDRVYRYDYFKPTVSNNNRFDSNGDCACGPLIPAGAALIHFPAGRNGRFVVPDFVKRIETRAFEGSAMLDSLAISDSVLSIGSSAFRSCSALAAVRLPRVLYNIGTEMFKDCRNLREITLPANIYRIRTSMFEN
jgi:hypothetical protein